jgi:septal ring-binding cell division protein DamX
LKILFGTPVAKRNAVQEVIASNARFTADQLYKKRVMAGSPWYNHKKDDKYTVQLMVLKSASVEENFKEMLQEDRYRQEAGNFFIFRKLATSNTLFIFYGEYATIFQTRLAQSSLPQFLRDHKPYAISVKGAIAKVRRQ